MEVVARYSCTHFYDSLGYVGPSQGCSTLRHRDASLAGVPLGYGTAVDVPLRMFHESAGSPGRTARRVSSSLHLRDANGLNILSSSCRGDRGWMVGTKIARAMEYCRTHAMGAPATHDFAGT